jgi:hypothetical protein
MIFWQPGVTLEEIEKQVILKAFSCFQGNKTQTARSLGIAVRTLDSKLEQYSNKEASLNESALLPPDERVHVQSPSQTTKKQSVHLRKR